MPKPIVNIEALLQTTLDLESGHSVEAVLKQHSIPERWSAYDVVDRYSKNLRHLESATSDYYTKLWRQAVKDLEPVVKAIAQHLEDTANA